MPGSDLLPSDLAPGLLLGDKVAIGEGATIGGHVIIHSGVRIGPGARVGDHAQIRDGAAIGAGSTVGSYVSVDPGVVIGERVSIQTRCYITGGTRIEDDVFVGPGVTLTNDNTMNRHDPEFEFEGPLLRRACRVGARVLSRSRRSRSSHHRPGASSACSRRRIALLFHDRISQGDGFPSGDGTRAVCS